MREHAIIITRACINIFILALYRHRREVLKPTNYFFIYVQPASQIHVETVEAVSQLEMKWVIFSSVIAGPDLTAVCAK